MRNDIRNIITCLTTLTAESEPGLRTDREAFIENGLSLQDMQLVNQFLQEELDNISALTQLEGDTWYAHYIKKDVSKTSSKDKQADTPRITVKYNPTQEAWKVFIKPSGVREYGVTKVDGTVKHVVTNGLELSFVDNSLHLSKVVMTRAIAKDKASLAHNQMKNSTDVIVYRSSSQERVLPVRTGATYYTEPYCGKQASTLLSSKHSDTLEEQVFQNLCDYVMQVGSQVSAMHNKGFTHSDLKLENVLFDIIKFDGEAYTKFTVIDLPDVQRSPVDFNKNNLPRAFTPNKTAVSMLKESREIQALQTELLSYGINIKSPLNIASTSACGHMDDSFAFLFTMLLQVQLLDDESPVKQKCMDFIKEKMEALFESIYDHRDFYGPINGKYSEKTIWDGFTVESLKNDFGEFCQKNDYEAWSHAEATYKVVHDRPISSVAVAKAKATKTSAIIADVTWSSASVPQVGAKVLDKENNDPKGPSI